MSGVTEARRFFAEELEVVCNLQTRALVEAFATVPREDFLPAGPWTLLSMPGLIFGGSGENLLGSTASFRRTIDADARRVYHNVGLAIDASRQLFNGHPGTLATWIDALALSAGNRVLHVGCGLGYYTAVMARTVGPTGRVVACEVDESLASEARQKLRSMTWVDVRHDGASSPLAEAFDAILINAGVTHPMDWWMDALAPAGRMLVPLTVSMPGMPPTIGKGLMWALTRAPENAAADLDVRILGPVAIYSAVGLRDERLASELQKAMSSAPAQWMAVNRLRRDRHDPASSCWLHGPTFCLSRDG